MSELYMRMQPFLGDRTELLQRMAGRLDLWEECVLLFPKEEIIEEMDEAKKNGDEAALYATVHRLKGNLANFGFDKAAATAMELLAAIKNKESLRIAELYPKLRETYIQIIERIGEAE